jgi:hypothetical protein
MTPEEIAAAAAAEAAAANPPPPAEPPAPDPPPKPGEADARRAAYDARKLAKELDDLRKENEGYKRRDDDARKAQLTKEQALQEERDTIKAENDRLKADRLKDKVAAEFKLPPVLAARLIGSDEESLRADAEELMKSIPKPVAGSPTNPVREQGSARIYTRAELAKDPTLAASPEVRQAAREGRVK